MTKKFFLVSITMLTLGALLLTGCGQSAPANQADIERAVPVEVIEAHQGDIQLTSTYSGTIHPWQSVTVTPKINGKIAAVHVQDGDVVTAGDVLVQLDTTDISAQVDQAKVGYDLALLQLEKVKAGTRTEQLEQNRAALSISQAQYEAAKVAWERSEQLYQVGAIPKQQLEQTETQYQVAAAQLKQAEESLRMAEAGAAPEDIRIAEAQVTQAEVSLNNARTQLNNALITAPISGIVSGVSAKVGEMAGSSVPVTVINQLDIVEVQVNLTEKDINRVKKGQETAVVVSAAAREPFLGKITNISPVADPRTNTFLTKVEIANQNGLLKGGMSASVRIVTEEEKDGIVVPIQAILQQNGDQVMYVIADGVAERRLVTLGLGNEDEIIVTTGIAEGETIVIKGQHYLEEGSKVTVVGREE